jgi:ABC-type sugar transport system, periplasmic component
MTGKHSRKRIASLFIIGLIALLVAACGGGANNKTEEPAQSGGNESTETGEKAPEDYKGEFVLWSWVQLYPEGLKAFNEKYPNIKIKYVEVHSEDVTKKLQTTIASGGVLPDVIRIERAQKAKIFDMDILENLETAPFNADRSLLFDYDIPAFSKDGNLIAIPDDMAISGLAYIKSLAREYFGTDVPEELEAMFTDWDVFIEKGKEVTGKSNGKVKMISSLGSVWEIIKGQRKASFFDGDTLNTEVLRERVARLVQFRDAGIVGKLDQWTPAWNAAFGGNDYIFAYSPVWMPHYVIGPNDKEDDRWALMVAPEGGFIRGGSSHGIPKGAPNAELGWKWIEFMSLTQEGAEAQKEDGVFTHYKPAYEDKEFTNWTWRNFGDQNIGEKFFEDISPVTTDVPENVNDNYLDEVMNIIVQTLNKDEAFGVDQAMEKIVQELKAKNPDIVVS